MSKLLTVGMATFDDFNGVYFTIQALRMYHSICNSNDVEFIVLDNNPDSPHGKATQDFVKGWLNSNGKYIPYTDSRSSFNKYKIVDHATGKYILILDCHVLLAQNSINTLLNYFNKTPNCKDLVQGPLWYDDLKNYSTEFFPQWRDSMYGTWHTNHDAHNTNEPFDIQLQGMGMCAFEKKNWPGICPHFKGFGGEEGYIQEKFRRQGGRTVCIPQLKWAHRFGRPDGVKYPLILEDRIWNYFVGWLEITRDPNHPMVTSTYEHFKDKIPVSSLDKLLADAKSVIFQ